MLDAEIHRTLHVCSRSEAGAVMGEGKASGTPGCGVLAKMGEAPGGEHNHVCAEQCRALDVCCPRHLH